MNLTVGAGDCWRWSVTSLQQSFFMPSFAIGTGRHTFIEVSE